MTRASGDPDRTPNRVVNETVPVVPHRRAKPRPAPAPSLRAGDEAHSAIAENYGRPDDDRHRVRYGIAVATDRPGRLARVSARPPERPHPLAAGVDRRTS